LKKRVRNLNYFEQHRSRDSIIVLSKKFYTLLNIWRKDKRKRNWV